MMKVLLLEDDFILAQSVKTALVDLGLSVETFFNGNDAMTAVFSTPYSLYLLDINVPGFSGFEMISAIRENDKETPIVMISTQIESASVLQAFDLGANDYMRKPFDLNELIARVKHQLSMLSTQSVSDSISLGYGYAFSLNSFDLFLNGEPVSLTSKERALIGILAKDIGKTVRNEYLLDYVWNGEVESSALRYHIHNLSKKIQQGMILNVRGVGYRLEKPVDDISHEDH